MIFGAFFGSSGFRVDKVPEGGLTMFNLFELFSCQPEKLKHLFLFQDVIAEGRLLLQHLFAVFDHHTFIALADLLSGEVIDGIALQLLGCSDGADVGRRCLSSVHGD